MEKEDVAEKALSYQIPVYICRFKDCKMKFKYKIDYLMHLAEERTTKEMLDGFDWKINNEEIFIKRNRVQGGLKYSDVKSWIEELGKKVVYEKVYFFVENGKLQKILWIRKEERVFD